MGVAHCLVSQWAFDELCARRCGGDNSFEIDVATDHGDGFWLLTIRSEKIPVGARYMWHVIFEPDGVRFAEDLDT